MELLGFWDEIYKKTLIKNTESMYNKEVISDVMCRYISDEIKKHDCYVKSLYRSKLKGDLSDEDYQNKLEYERNEVSLIIKGILEGEFDWVK
jgi:hypothetical protein